MNFGASNVITINNFYTTGRIENIILNANQIPVLSGDRSVSVNESGRVILTTVDLNATDIDNTVSELTYTASSINSHIIIQEWNGSSWINSDNSFTQAQLEAGQIAVLHDGYESNTASFNIRVSDGNTSSSILPVSVNVNLFNDVTNQLSGDFLISTTNTNYQLSPQITALSNGNFLVTWQSNDNGSNYDIRGRIFNTDGSAVNASDFLVSTTNTNNQISPQITNLSNGNFLVTWQSNDNGSNYDIRGRIFNVDGSAVNVSDFLVSTTNTNDQTTPQITNLSNGGFVVTWNSYDNSSISSDIRGRVFNADGSALNGMNDFLVSTTNIGNQIGSQIISLSNGGFVVTWDSHDNGFNQDIRGRVFNADGSALNGMNDFLISTSNNSSQTTPQITNLSNGGFVVTWDSLDNGLDSDIRGRVFNADGSAVNTSDFLVSTTNTNNQNTMQITSLSNGGFVITWRSNDNESIYYGIRGRVFNADGSAVNTSDFLVSTSNNYAHYTPQITALSNGGFVVTWNTGDVRGRIFNADGSALNGMNDFLISTSNNNDQTNPQIIALSNGGFVVAWRSLDNGSDIDIRGRVFNADGTPVGDLVGTGTIANDLLISQSTSKEILSGNTGNDLYIFRNTFGNDIVRDTLGIDSIDLSDFMLASATFTRQEGALTGGDDLFINLGSNGTILIEKYFAEDSNSVAGTGLIETISFQDDSSVDLTQIASMGL